MSIMLIEIKKTDEKLEKINNQRRKWLIASSIVFIGIIFLIFAWDWLDRLDSSIVWWIIISCMLIISMNWWYWTMKVIRQLIHHQKLEFNLLSDIITEIKSIKENLEKIKH